jgi:hypothetical protein
VQLLPLQKDQLISGCMCCTAVVQAGLGLVLAVVF